MFRKWIAKRVINSFRRRFKRIENATLRGQLTKDQALAEWEKCKWDCKSFLMDTPNEYLPDYLQNPTTYDEKEMIRRVIKKAL